MTKDQILAQIKIIESQKTELEKGNKEWKNLDLDRREKLSKFLGSTKPGRYGGDDELVVLDWPEIYFEIGKLIQKKNADERIINAIQNVQNLEHAVSTQGNMIEEITRKIFKEGGK